MTFELIDGAKISVIDANVVYDAQPMLVTKNAVHPREVNTIVHARHGCRGIRVRFGSNERTNDRSIDRSIDPWKREYAPVRFLLIERQLLAAAHVRAVSSKVPGTEKCAKTALKFVYKDILH